ncbi:hypothetical protein QUB68_28735 [Microcoleus sp. A006_D1]
MGRSLKVSPGCTEQVKSALGRNGFPSQKALAEELDIGLSTVKKFLTGQPVDYSYFLEISERLGYEWRNIVSCLTSKLHWVYNTTVILNSK